MKSEKRILTLKNKEHEVMVDVFDNDDLENVCSIYKQWVKISSDLKKLGCRRINFPEISEIFFCILYDSVRVNSTSIPGEHSSFDCYNLNRKTTIQVKSASSEDELTSFGPKSTWDELYFLDFYNEGNYDGTFEVFKIPNNLVYEWIVSKKENVTFLERQLEGKRPRFSLRKLIETYEIKPEKTINLCEIVEELYK